MADIDIVPKQASRTWVWLVIILALIALAFWFFNREPARSTRADGPRPTFAMNQTAPITPAIGRILAS